MICRPPLRPRRSLLKVASRYGSFPILVETYRECLSDVFDLPALREILAGVARREIVIHSVETVRASGLPKASKTCCREWRSTRWVTVTRAAACLEIASL